ncbi:MAG TPA: diacylglycerol kinase family protein [Bauldia sp.]|nr:diacylglycerol kinase family protein [Bauldia sp.]
MKVALILNRNAGTLRTLDADKTASEIAAVFREAGHEVAIHVAEGNGAVAAIRRAAKEAEAIVVGGGDGTIAAAASIAAETGVTLGILPLGTMNFFARSLGIPTDMKEAAAALATAEVRAVDIGRVNGRSFIHTLSLGLHPAMVAEREKLPYGSRIGKMIGSVRAFLHVVRHPRRFFIAIDGKDGAIEQRTAGVVISNNPLGKGHMPYADRLDQGVLGVYVTTARGWLQLARVTAAAAIGAAETHPLVAYLETPRLTVRLGRRAAVPTSLDGELVRVDGPLKVEIVPGGLKVLAPRLREPG